MRPDLTKQLDKYIAEKKPCTQAVQECYSMLCDIAVKKVEAELRCEALKLIASGLGRLATEGVIQGDTDTASLCLLATSRTSVGSGCLPGFAR